ncbi:MAG TPA: DUF1648 domain-containing protein [Verrucomicrobiae bacterium]|nr:DUF1648 domain-containing protein [Verrucomicrobiae bacterium]
MKRNLVPVLVLTLLSAGYLVLVGGSAAWLPEQVAIHFGPGGAADRWIDRSQTIWFFETLTVVPVIFVALAMVMRWFPAGVFNLPRRDYWLAPERRAQTVGIISRQLIWMGCLVVLFLAGVYYLTIQANRATPARLPVNLFLPLLGAFLAGTTTWSIVFIRRFTKTA